MTYNATKKPIGHNHAGPPDSFLDTLIAWAKTEDESVFTPNAFVDIFTIIRPVLGPWESPLHRRAVLCEVLRVLAGDESDWNWREGRDTTAGSQTPEEMETGAFQVSYDARRLGSDLNAWLINHGIFNASEFRSVLRDYPSLDLAYTARLLRDATRWDGPLNRGWVREQVSNVAVREFMTLLV